MERFRNRVGQRTIEAQQLDLTQHARTFREPEEILG
jgi:hypothetical protein